uniref:Uncharacterized protein n=1 Tax=Cacopsylla melanoneura TaxID=428564 RepID=A0A8D8PLS5_9HEMI
MSPFSSSPKVSSYLTLTTCMSPFSSSPKVSSYLTLTTCMSPFSSSPKVSSSSRSFKVTIVSFSLTQSGSSTSSSPRIICTFPLSRRSSILSCSEVLAGSNIFSSDVTIPLDSSNEGRSCDGAERRTSPSLKNLGSDLIVTLGFIS